MEEYTVLLVDDEEAILRSLQRALRRESYRILTAGSGAEGLKILASNQVQLVVSDQRMPIMTGTQFLQQVQERWPDAIRVILSGYAEPNIIVEAVNSGGVYRFMGKPWNDEELKTTIRQCLEHYRILCENRRLNELAAEHIRQLESVNQRLELAVLDRTRTLMLAQDILENLPHMVLGISRDHELMIANEAARRALPEIGSALPGTDIDTVLPPAAVEAVNACLAGNLEVTRSVGWNGTGMRAHVAPLAGPQEPRGCILLLEAEPT
ncbi:MAG: response regulator [bacterium]|nr:response regulator [bacterium]